MGHENTPEMLKGKLSASPTDAKGPLLRQGRLRVSTGDAIGDLVHLNKMRGVHHKTSV